MQAPIRLLAFALFVSLPTVCSVIHAQTPVSHTELKPAILTREQAGGLMPASVFFRGQTASIQARNSSGLRLAGDRLLLVALVDTAGYSSAIQQSYQAYLITEVPLQFGQQTLGPGAYGVGFVGGNSFACLDLGGGPVLSTASLRDTALSHPTPLQILPVAASPDGFRLYFGRNYVEFAPLPRKD